MKFGMGLPLGAAVEFNEIKDAVLALEAGGVDYVTLAGHVLSTEAGRFSDRPEGTYAGAYQDQLTSFAYLAAVTTRIEFMTGTLILPLYPTALFAKQAAQLSIMSGGRFILGASISWNPFEYQALGQDVHVRGRRLDEQITLLRRLWTEPYVQYEGRFHKLDGVGLKQLPPPIPIWLGSGTTDPVLRRVARLADGWLSMGDATEPMTRLRGYLAEEKRDPATFGLTGRLNAANEDPAEWVDGAKRLAAIGTTRITIGPPPTASLREQVHRAVKVRQAVAPALT